MCSLPWMVALCFICSTLPLRKGIRKCPSDFLRPVIFHLSVNIHCDLAAFVSSQILNGLRINARVNQIRDISMPKLMRRHIKIQTVNNMSVVPGFFSQHGIKGVLHIFPANKFLCWPGLSGARDDISPEPFELRIGKRLAIAVCDNIF